MGIKNRATIARQLIQAGRSFDTPVAIIQNGTSANQKDYRGKLADLMNEDQLGWIETPAIIVIGHVAALQPELDSAESAPGILAALQEPASPSTGRVDYRRVPMGDPTY